MTTAATVNVGATAGSLMAVIGAFRTSGAIDSGGVANAFSAKVSVANVLANAGQTVAATNTLGALAFQIAHRPASTWKALPHQRC